VIDLSDYDLCDTEGWAVASPDPEGWCEIKDEKGASIAWIREAPLASAPNYILRGYVRPDPKGGFAAYSGTRFSGKNLATGVSLPEAKLAVFDWMCERITRPARKYRPPITMRVG
jgi:hypothetical protein